MSIRRTVTTLAVATTFALGITPALAQDTSESTSLGDFSEMDGIEEAVSRTWTIDMEAMLTNTPEDGADPLAGLSGTFVVFGAVAKFDDEDSAKDAFHQFSTASEEDLDLTGSEDAKIERGDVDDLGDEAYRYEVTSESDGTDSVIELAREDNVLLVGVSVSMGEASDDANPAHDLVEYMVEDGDEGGTAEFNDDGSSTGGLWNYFPDDDFDAVADLIPGGDEQIYPTDEDAS